MLSPAYSDTNKKGIDSERSAVNWTMWTTPKQKWKNFGTTWFMTVLSFIPPLAPFSITQIV